MQQIDLQLRCLAIGCTLRSGQSTMHELGFLFTQIGIEMSYGHEFNIEISA